MVDYRVRCVWLRPGETEPAENLDGVPPETPVIVWGHGWGLSSKAMVGLASRLNFLAAHACLDFPGFGDAPDPDASWSVPEYTADLAQFLDTELAGRTIWYVGHSFGARVGVRLAHTHPQSVKGLVLMAAAGIPRQRSALEQLRLNARVTAFKALRLLAATESQRERLRRRFGSADYAAASPALRPVFGRVVRDDVTAAAREVICPTLILCGEADTETPPDIAERLAALIPNSRLHLLPHFGHNDILTRGAAQSAQMIRDFVEDAFGDDGAGPP